MGEFPDSVITPSHPGIQEMDAELQSLSRVDRDVTDRDLEMLWLRKGEWPDDLLPGILFYPIYDARFKSSESRIYWEAGEKAGYNRVRLLKGMEIYHSKYQDYMEAITDPTKGINQIPDGIPFTEDASELPNKSYFFEDLND